MIDSTKATTTRSTAEQSVLRRSGGKVEALGYLVGRLGLAFTILWIGSEKFTADEAAGIEPLISHSPFFGWLLDIVAIRSLSAGIGVIEVVAAALLIAGLVSNRLGALGAALAVGTFVVTISFLFTSTSYAHTFPFLSMGGNFIIKDVVLLGMSLLLLAKAINGLPGRTSIGR